MANELKIGIVVSYSKSGAKYQRSEHLEVDVAGDSIGGQIQSIPASNTALVVPAAIGTVGWVWIKNLDATNYVTVGLTASYAIKLLAGESTMFRSAGTIFALANTAACLVEYMMFEL